MLDCVGGVSCDRFTMPPVELDPVELEPVLPEPVELLVEPDVPEVDWPVVPEDPDVDDWAARCGATDSPSPRTAALIKREFLRT